MDKTIKHLLKVANEKSNPRVCKHHFVICEDCDSRINVLKLIDIIKSQTSPIVALNGSPEKGSPKDCSYCNNGHASIDDCNYCSYCGRELLK